MAENRRTIDVKYDADAAWLIEQASKVPPAAKVTVHKAASYDNPVDHGGEVTITFTWQD